MLSMTQLDGLDQRFANVKVFCKQAQGFYKIYIAIYQIVLSKEFTDTG